MTWSHGGGRGCGREGEGGVMTWSWGGGGGVVTWSWGKGGVVLWSPGGGGEVVDLWCCPSPELGQTNACENITFCHFATRSVLISSSSPAIIAIHLSKNL